MGEWFRAVRAPTVTPQGEQATEHDVARFAFDAKGIHDRIKSFRMSKTRRGRLGTRGERRKLLGGWRFAIG